MMRVIKFIFPKKAIKFVFSSLLYLIILFITSDVRSQTRFSSLRLDNSSGLSNSCINTIFEDSEHLIWFGTWDGLNVYDGSSFHVFNYGDGNNSIGNNVIYYLGEDKDRNIWIATIEGISRYDKKNGKFSHYFYSHDKNAKVVDKGFLLTIDANGNVFCTPKSSPYINYYDAKKDRFIKCIVPGFSNQKIIKIFSLNNELWILGNNGTLAAYTTVKNNLTSIKRYTNPGTITDFFSANNHLFFTTQNKELYHATKEGVFNKVSDLPYAVRAITYYKNKYILGWSTIGMVELDSSFTKSASLIKEVPSLSGVRITSLHTTGNNILWVGTDGSGILKVREKDNQFGLVKQLPDGNPINIPIRAFNEVDGNVWIGTKGNGIISIKNLGSPQSSYTSIRSFYSDFDILNNCVYAIEKGSDGFVYVGSDASGVTIYDTKKRTWINWGNVAGSKNYFPFKSVHSIHYDRDSSVWLGTESFGLIHLKLKRDKFGNPQVSYIYKYSYTGNSKGPGN